LQENDVALVHRDALALTEMQTVETGYGELTVLGLMIQICDLAVRDEMDTLRRQSGLQGQHQRFVLIVDGPFYARQGINVRKLR
jgi:hypothetical protein